MTDGNDPDHDVEALLERIDDKDETISSLELALEEKKAGLEEKDEQIEDVKEADADVWKLRGRNGWVAFDPSANVKIEA